MIYLRVSRTDLLINIWKKVNNICRPKKKKFSKTMTWRVTASLTTFLIASILTVDLLIGVFIGSIEVIAKIFLYYYQEKIWNNINWAKN